jgi:hypothetical protein
MPVTRIKSEWSGGNLVFKGVDGYYVRFGTTDNPVQVKVHTRPTTLGSALEVRTKPSSATAEHAAIDAMLEPDPTGDTQTAGYGRAVQGVVRTISGNTMTGGSLHGVYGQVCNLGTINGAGVMVSAMYGLIEDGGTYTAVSHLAAAWLDSHLDQAVSAGSKEFLYISNNGDTTFDNALYVYAGNKITNLFNINTASGMVAANDAGGAGLNFTNWRTIKIVLEGETYYLVAAKTIANAA